MVYMRYLPTIIIWSLSLICLVGCNRHSAGTHVNENETVVADDSRTETDSAEAVVDTAAIAVAEPRKLSAKELTELQNLISDRLQRLDNNPLQQNVWGCGVLADAVEVSLAINTPYWQAEFKKYISDSPNIMFAGPSTPQPVSERVDSTTELADIRLRPDSASFSIDSDYATFTLENDSRENITFGVDYIVGFRGADKRWYRLPHPGIWNDLGITLLPTGRYSIKAALNPGLNKNRPGTYRLYKQIQYEGEKGRYWLMTEFELTDRH